MVNEILKTLQVGRQLLDHYGLEDWEICLDNAKSRVGQCRYEDKEIGVSSTYLEKTPWREIEDTIRHEIAHALVGPNHGHDYVWRQKAIEVGANPQRCATTDAVATAKPNYRIKCPNCNWSVERFRMRRRNFGSTCPRCHTEVVIYKITRKNG